MKPIRGFPNYSVTSGGEIYSHHSKRFLKQQLDRYGYPQIKLRKAGSTYNRKVHRLVLETFNFIEGCENLQVNHVDGDKTNNSLENLEWCTHMENSLHADQSGLVTKKLRRRGVKVYTLDGIFLDCFISTMEAHRYLGIPQVKISQCCRGIYKEYMGYVFRYIEDPFLKYPVSVTKYHTKRNL